MKKEYDFSKGRRGAVIPITHKTRITIYLDDKVVEGFRKKANKTGKGYQTLINEILNHHLGHSEPPVTRAIVRQIVQEELMAAA